MRPIGRRGSAIDADTLETCGGGAARGGVLTGRAAGGELDGRADGGELAGLCDCGRTSVPGGGVASAPGADIGDADIAGGGIDGGAYETGPCGVTAGRAPAWCCG
jgi:hypothetical protein